MNPRKVGKPRPSGLVSEFHPGNGIGSARRGRCGDYHGNNSGTQYGRPALSLDGANDELDYATPYDEFSGDAIAVIAFWIKADEDGADSDAIYYDEWAAGGNERIKVTWEHGDNTIKVSVRSGATGDTARTASSTATTAGVYHSVIVTIDAADEKVSFYIDGAAAEKVALSGALTQATFAASVPAEQCWCSSAGAEFFKGDLIYAGILGAAAVPTTADSERFHNNPKLYFSDNSFGSYFLFNESSGSINIDYSGNGNALTITGATWDFGANGGNSHRGGRDVYSFVSANGDYLISTTSPTASGAIAAWFVEKNDADIFVGSQTAAGGRCYLGQNNNKLSGGIGEEGLTTIVGATSLGAGTANHGVITWNGTTVKLYLNGSEDYSAGQDGTTPSHAWYVGAHHQNAAATLNWNANLWDVKIYDSFLSAADAKALFRGESTSATAIREWSLEGTLVDDTGNDNLTIGTAPDTVNGPYDMNGDQQTADGLYFDGANDYIAIPDSADHDPGGAMSISLWAKFQLPLTDDGVIILHDLSAFKWQIGADSDGGSDIDIDFQVVTASGTTVSGDYVGAADTWYHIVGTYDKTLGSNRVKLYINGAIEQQANGFNEDITAGNEGITIGRTGAVYSNVQVDNVQYYTRALTALEIAALYNRGRNG